jgi:hypothetical protein
MVRRLDRAELSSQGEDFQLRSSGEVEDFRQVLSIPAKATASSVLTPPSTPSSQLIFAVTGQSPTALRTPAATSIP